MANNNDDPSDRTVMRQIKKAMRGGYEGDQRRAKQGIDYVQLLIPLIGVAFLAFAGYKIMEYRIGELEKDLNKVDDRVTVQWDRFGEFMEEMRDDHRNP